jgi:hypothetical protein
VLSRVAGGPAFRVLGAPDEGIMPVPWDPIYKSQWKTFVAAFGAKYDSNPQLRYVVMTGFQQVAECYLARTPEDMAFFGRQCPGGRLSPHRYFTGRLGRLGSNG